MSSIFRLRRFLPLSLLTLVPALLPAQTITAPGGPGPAFAWSTEFSASGKSAIAEGTRALGDIRHSYAAAEASTTLALDQGSALILGGSWKRFDFSGSRADAPESLTALSLKLGYARQLSPQWSLRAEIDPGVYSDFEDVSGDDFNAPFGVRLLYAQSRELQWGFALFVDPRGSNPVIGGVGARWVFAPDWTLLFFLPEPRIEYAVSPTVSLYAGAGLRGGTFRVAEDFGRKRGRAALDNQDVDFRELSAGVGVRWTIDKSITAELGVGRLLDRRFEYEKRNLLLNGDGAVQFNLSVSGSF